MGPRYAIYFAPDTDSAFWARASAWLGRDAASGVELVQPEVAGLTGEHFAEITADPRHYGFHATLKAPFSLRETSSEAELLAALAEFGTERKPFETALSPQSLGAFLAIRPLAFCPKIQALHDDAVRHFEPFRAPLSEDDLARRRRARLSDEQDALLVQWGYPYVFEHFRFHMTLTGSIADEVLRDAILQEATRYFAEDIGPQLFASISLFRQADRGSPFTIVASCPFLQT